MNNPTEIKSNETLIYNYYDTLSDNTNNAVVDHSECIDTPGGSKDEPSTSTLGGSEDGPDASQTPGVYYAGVQTEPNVTHTLPTPENIPNSVYVKMCVCNGQSIRLKTPIINDYKNEHDLDMYLIVESWLTEQHTKEIGELKQNGYEVLQNPRQDRMGGGILCLFKGSY